jgi:hypothetical protein
VELTIAPPLILAAGVEVELARHGHRIRARVTLANLLGQHVESDAANRDAWT